MTTFRIILPLIKQGLSRNYENYATPAFLFSIRKISSIQLSKHCELITQDKINNVKITNMKLSVPRDKPLVICLTWLMAKRKNVLKYANLYLENGFDVLNVVTSPWHVLWPVKGIQLVARDMLDVLKANESYSPLLIHGFSVGAYLWGEVLVHATLEKNKYQAVMNRICGQIWDSSVDVTEIHLGIPKAVFPKNLVLQNALQQYITYHLKAFDNVATKHYVRASQMFHTNTARVPALFYLSKSDPIGSESANIRARESWESMGVPVYWNCFEKSSHVGHFRYYPDIYKAELFAFLEKLSLISQQQKMQIKV